jgi:pyruvate/2-oxoglutarate dehydrogenase complex dihydrolipoamide dehydrogenase (E3) component
VGGEEIEADNIYLNVGCRAAAPALPGLAKVPYLTNSSILALEEIPEHLLIIGGSYVALEFAQMFRRFGAKVTIIEKSDRLVSREDPDTSHCIEDILRTEDILIKTGAACIGIDGVPGNITAHLNGTEKVSGSHLLLAVGRVPNTADLGLDVAGVMTDERGFIQVDDCLRTSVPHIWAMGDCNGKGAFTHTSYNDYEIIAANVLDRESRKLSDRITAYAIYIDPPMGRAGLTEAQAKATGRRIASGMRPMSRVSRAVEKGEEQGFMRITVDLDSSEILGAVIIGPGADEAIHSVLDMMAARAPWQTLQHVMHIHPTVSELLPTILGELKPVT